MESARFLVAVADTRREAEAYLYGRNEIVAVYEYEQGGRIKQVFLIECQAEGGFGAAAQGQRLASGSLGGFEVYEQEAAEQMIADRFGAKLTWSEASVAIETGLRSRPSALAGSDCS